MQAAAYIEKNNQQANRYQRPAKQNGFRAKHLKETKHNLTKLSTHNF